MTLIGGKGSNKEKGSLESQLGFQYTIIDCSNSNPEGAWSTLLPYLELEQYLNKGIFSETFQQSFKTGEETECKVMSKSMSMEKFKRKIRKH